MIYNSEWEIPGNNFGGEHLKPRVAEFGDKNLIGANVIRLRKAAQMTQKSLMAQMQILGVDINYASLSKLEGQTRMATDKELFVLAKIFGVEIEDLFS